MHRLDRIDQSCSLIPMEASIREGFQEKIEFSKKCERAWQCGPVWRGEGVMWEQSALV